MKEGFREIEILMGGLVDHLKRAGCSVRSYTMPTGDISQIKPEAQIAAADFVLAVKDSEEYAQVLKARALVSEKTWSDYDLFGFTGLQEQNIYNKALEALRVRWNQGRPSYWGRHYEERKFEEEVENV